jgi:hypothetical protein
MFLIYRRMNKTNDAFECINKNCSKEFFDTAHTKNIKYITSIKSKMMDIKSYEEFMKLYRLYAKNVNNKYQVNYTTCMINNCNKVYKKLLHLILDKIKVTDNQLFIKEIIQDSKMLLSKKVMTKEDLIKLSFCILFFTSLVIIQNK